MAVVLHNIVGLLNGSMEIYDAWCDRVPVLILGGTGPGRRQPKRRPDHRLASHSRTCRVRSCRDFTKWDDQPASVPAHARGDLAGVQAGMSGSAGAASISASMCVFRSSALEQRL